MKKIIIAMIVIVLLIMIIITGLLFLQREPEPENEADQGDVGLNINLKETVVEPVTDSISFFTVRNVIQGYLNSINLKSSSYFDDYGEQIASDSEISNIIYNLLSKEYLNQNSISKNNVLNSIFTTNDDLIFVPLKMNYLLLDGMTKYAVQGFCVDWDNAFVKDFYFIVNVDENNKTFSITPIDSDEVNSIDDVKLDRKVTAIEVESNNVIRVQNITDKFLCQEYFMIQKRLMLANPKLSYSYIDEDYRNARFGSLENYLKYVAENKEHISKMALRGYEVERMGSNTKCLCKDQYENYYIFNVKEVLNYKILLDIYTVEQDTAKTAYAEYTDRQKIAYNVNKWVQMINNKDYQGAYDVLNENFKNNNWISVNDFEAYIKQNYPSYYQIEYTDYEESGENAIQTIILKDFDNIEQDKSLKIVMKLKDEMNFEMAISM